VTSFSLEHPANPVMNFFFLLRDGTDDRRPTQVIDFFRLGGCVASGIDPLNSGSLCNAEGHVDVDGV
jgi:hypothetical protein